MENNKDSPEVLLPSLIKSADSNQVLGFDDGVIKQDGSSFRFMVRIIIIDIKWAVNCLT